MDIRSKIKTVMAAMLHTMVFGEEAKLKGKTPRERAAYALDKGLMSAPSWLDRESQIDWVYRKRGAAYWEGK